MTITKAFAASLIFLLHFSCLSERPRVLIIGDSISLGYTPFVKASLSNDLDVFHNPGNAQHTGTGLDSIRQWAGRNKWDIIQFNWGLWDLCYRDSAADNPGHRDKIHGRVTYPVDAYTANLDSIITILQSITKAKLIFVTSTCVPDNEPGRFPGDVTRYNAAAIAVMKKHGVAINDIYERSITIHQQYGLGPGDVHYTQEGYRELGKLITRFLETAVKK